MALVPPSWMRIEFAISCEALPVPLTDTGNSQLEAISNLLHFLFQLSGPVDVHDRVDGG